MAPVLDSRPCWSRSSQRGASYFEYLLLVAGVALLLVAGLRAFSTGPLNTALIADGEALLCWIAGHGSCGNEANPAGPAKHLPGRDGPGSGDLGQGEVAQVVSAQGAQLISVDGTVMFCSGAHCLDTTVDEFGNVFLGAYVDSEGALVLPEPGAAPVGTLDDVILPGPEQRINVQSEVRGTAADVLPLLHGFDPQHAPNGATLEAYLAAAKLLFDGARRHVGEAEALQRTRRVLETTFQVFDAGSGSGSGVLLADKKNQLWVATNLHVSTRLKAPLQVRNGFLTLAVGDPVSEVPPVIEPPLALDLAFLPVSVENLAPADRARLLEVAWTPDDFLFETAGRAPAGTEVRALGYAVGSRNNPQRGPVVMTATVSDSPWAFGELDQETSSGVHDPSGGSGAPIFVADLSQPVGLVVAHDPTFFQRALDGLLNIEPLNPDLVYVRGETIRAHARVLLDGTDPR